MNFAETKEEQIEYVENDISRLEKEYNSYKLRAKYFAFGAVFCSFSAFILIIIQFQVFHCSSSFNAFLIICLFLSAIILTAVAIFSRSNEALCQENISRRKSALNLMKNDYEKYTQEQNQAFERIIRQQSITKQTDEIHSPQCPICGSYDLSPITPMQKAGKIFLWGAYAVGDVSKTWKCNNCGSKF